MARRRFPREDLEINITPMLDIVFIMLIFFVVTTSFTRETGAVIDRPQADRAAELAGAAILIGIRPTDEIWMDKQAIELREVRQNVERARSENPEAGVVIVADKGSSIGMVTRVMDQVRLAGVQTAAIAAEQPGG